MRSSQIDELHRRVGRNLLRFQAMEFALKLVEPNTAGTLPSEFIRQARNDLVHHFDQLPGVDLLEPEGVAHASAWLDDQFEKSNESYHCLRVHSLRVLLALVESGSALAAEYGFCHQKLLAQVPPGFEYIDEGEATDDVWATSRIVGLLQLARVTGID